MIKNNNFVYNNIIKNDDLNNKLDKWDIFDN